VLIYMAIYMAMTLGAFACVLAMRTEKGPVETIDDLSGLAQTQGGVALALGTLMFALAGIPPLAGFWGKYYVFVAAVQANLWPLAVIGVVASVVAAYYYLRIVKVMYFDEPRGRFLPVQFKTAAVMGLATILVVLAFLPFPLRIGSLGDWLQGAAQTAARSLF
jgi:NADH-quinone oxidoreductase subunit N